VVLAAGQGKRMKSSRPKVLHDVCGRPCLWHVLRAAQAAKPSELIVVVGQGRDQVEEAVRSWKLKPDPIFVQQKQPLGTGHAVMVAEDAVAGSGANDVLVAGGDDPLVMGAHIRRLLAVHRRTKAAASVLTTQLDDPTGYARVVRKGNRLIELVGESVADRDPSVAGIREVATLVYAFRRDDLFKALPLLERDNRQREFYLFDVLDILRDKGEAISAVPVDWGAMGLNRRSGLADVSRIMRARIVRDHMERGVTFVDPSTSYVDADVRIGKDTVIHPLTFLTGATKVGSGCQIGPAARIIDSAIGDEAEVSFSVVRESRVGPRVSVGPYASLRPGTVLEEGSKAGTFVEMKATRVGKGSKVPHLSYMGDATIGEQANVGAGTITCNYDGYRKSRTVIGDGAFIGSDTMLVAPVNIGKNAVTGAGSAITRDVPAGALAVERAEQRTVRGYASRKKGARSGREGTDRGEDHGERRGGHRRGS
jgi:bifunctional UDP-N-acetylglucosamine pyrophosphorylase/glucosamine-1-phosphate N-acetyltransferase